MIVTSDGRILLTYCINVLNMDVKINKKKLWFIFILLCIKTEYSFSQTCNGTSGAPVFIETFGTGIGIVSLQSVDPAASTPMGLWSDECVPDGTYIITNSRTALCGGPPYWWGQQCEQTSRDHTGDVNGRMMVINGLGNPGGVFYSQTVASLCKNTQYKFSIWVYSFHHGLAPNLQFQIKQNNNLIASSSTGNVPFDCNWHQYSMAFTTGNTGNNFVLSLVNSTQSTSQTAGNDFVLDDIELTPCFPPMIPSCGGSVTANALTGTGPYAYNWSPSGGTNAMATGLSPGNYSVTINSSTGCTATQTVNVTASSFTATTNSQPATCSQANGTATVSLSGGVPSYTYLWNTTPPQTTQSATGLGIGSYSVFITDAMGCITTSSVIITNLNTVVATTTQTNISCYGGTDGLASVTASGGTPSYSYLWSNGQITPAISNISAGNYSITITDRSGCSTIQSLVITQPLVIALTSSATPASCTLTDGIATVTATGGVGNFSYQWDNNQTIQTVTGLSAGNYTVIVTDGNGCTNTATVSITTPSGPIASFSSMNECFNNPTPFTDRSSGGASQWSWNFGDGNSSTVQSPTHTYNTYGTFSVTLIATNSLGCKDSITHTVTVYPLPASHFISPVVCVGDSSCFTDSSTISTGNITGWSWNFNDPNSSSNISNTQNPCHTFSGAGKYNVILTATSNNGCQSTSNLTALVNGAPVAAFSFQNNCLNAPTTFTDHSNNAKQWAWNFGDGNTSTQQRPTHTYANYGTYQVKLLVTSGGICTDTISKTVTIYPLPVINFTGDSVCIRNPSSFTDLSTIAKGNISAWKWNFGDIESTPNDTSSQKNPSYIFSHAGNYSVTLTVSSNNGCISTISLPVVVYGNPVANFSSNPDPVVTLGDQIAFTDLSSGNVVQWSWNFGDNATSSIENPGHIYADTGNYMITLCVVSQYGCKDTIRHPIEVKEFSFYIPNAVTTNGDGINEYFFGKGIGITEYEMWIFDRWGNQIFSCHVHGLPQSLPCQWDGRVQGASGNLVQEDVYVWKVRFTNIFNKVLNYIGVVTVVK